MIEDHLPWRLIRFYWKIEEPIARYIDHLKDRREGIERRADIRPAQREVKRMNICRSYGHPDAESGWTSSSSSGTETMQFCPICGVSSRPATSKEYRSLVDCVVDT